MYKIITEFFLYILKALPVTIVTLIALFFIVLKPAVLDYQLPVFYKDGVHILDMRKGFTRVKLSPDDTIRVLDKIYCITHRELEIFVRPVGYWTMDKPTATPADRGQEEVLEWKYGS